MKKLLLSVFMVMSFAFLQAQQVNWLSWEQAALRMEKAPRKIMVDVYTDWCGWCKRMDAQTMTDPAVIKWLNETYYAVKMDGEGKNDIVFKGTTFKFIAEGSRGYHELPAQLMGGKMSYPTLVFLNENFDIIQPIPGFQPPLELEKILAYIGGNHYRITEWEKFSADFKSSISR
jgi:thioredoxin-related protein